VPPAGTPVDVPTALLLSLLVLGDPGSGKTTLLRYLALKLARRDPLLAAFARARIPRRGTLLLERICRRLSGAKVLWAGLFASLAARVAWIVQAFGSPTPWLSALAWVLLFGGMFFLVFRLSRRATAMVSLAAGSVLLGAGCLQPDLVGRWPVALAAVALAILLFLYWVLPPLAALGAWL